MYETIVYGSVLISSVLFGFLIRNLSTVLSRQLATAEVGLLLVFGLCQADGLHSAIVFLGNLLIIKLSRKHTSLLSFLWCFCYLLFFRCATFFSLPKPSPLANAIQLLLTLKLVSVAIEIHDFRIRRNSPQTENTETVKFQLQLESEPSTFDMLCYSYCYTGLFTGPFFKYRTYHDFLHTNIKDTKEILWKNEVYSRLKKITVFAVLYLITEYFFSIDVPKSDSFYDEPLWYRVFYMVPIFFRGRMRFYTAWLLAECSFVTLSLGAYDKASKPRPGHGPTIKVERNEEKVTEYDFETIRNIDPYGCEFSPTVRLGMRSWNMGVQWWLATYVHKRWPGSLKQLRIPAVMAVSAYWHGIDPGFFGAFLTMPFVMIAEDLTASLVKSRLPKKFHVTYDWLNWFAKMRSFEYMYMAFALLTWRDTYRYWESTYFWCHIAALSVIAICMLLKSALRKPRSESTVTEDSRKKEN